MRCKQLLLGALALMPVARAEAERDRSMLYAREASDLLGPTLWKRVIRIQNTSAESRYPRSFGALVFEMGGILWFYAATDGTQSLSLMRNHVKEDEGNLGPLLVGIDAGFSCQEIEPADWGMQEGIQTPPNACFIQSIALFRRELSQGNRVQRARLLSYYVALPTGIKGHTVLYLEARDGPTIIDPLAWRRPLRVRAKDLGDAKSVAYCLRRDVAYARWVSMGADDFALRHLDGARAVNN